MSAGGSVCGHQCQLVFRTERLAEAGGSSRPPYLWVVIITHVDLAVASVVHVCFILMPAGVYDIMHLWFETP